MELKMAAQTIRDTVDMQRILDLYGYTVKHGFMCCPFHGEKAPSLKVYPQTGGWHCFGCERGGSVVDFVMEHENCDFRTAVIAIDRALGLGLVDEHEDPRKAETERLTQMWLDRFVEAVKAFCDELLENIERERVALIRKVHALEEKRDTDIRTVTAREWDVILSWKHEDEHFDYRAERIRAFVKEVEAWRRKHRARAR